MYLYIFVLAAVIAGLGIIRLFRSALDDLLMNPDDFQRYMNQFFTRVALVEVIPILMLVFGFAYSPSEELVMSDAAIPLAIIAIIIIFNIFYTISQRSPAGNIEKELAQRIQTFIFITIALANAIPLIALVFILMVVI
ncbi:hypothetical protein [Oceanobacillus sp. J11TS1]|uniref:hypothetical protein n=1 Tax=Oceanobacillus sp. J11TS1 TaxID=2807191 RepID=UPI001B2DB5EB|nr:hypothetical protein [Oceanobacillus sp. J11TS1]GIO25277.1 hypothetical protein J11TS1_38580 [Oceanobacillus sp. J11TS1]